MSRDDYAAATLPECVVHFGYFSSRTLHLLSK